MQEYFDYYFLFGLKVVGPALLTLAVCKVLKS